MFHATKLILEAPIRLTSDATFQPWLAESWEESEDGIRVTLHLRQGVKFHNGRELTADDVVWAVELARNEELGHHLSDRFKTAEAEYHEFGGAYDRQIIDAIGDTGKLTLLHIHGEGIFFDLMTQYRVDLINWHDRLTWPNLQEAQACVGSALVSGVRERQTLVAGSADAIRHEVQDAIFQTGGRRLVIGPGCVIPTTTPEENTRTALASLPLHSVSI